MIPSKYDHNIQGCTGLLAGNRYGWQGGLRYVVAECSRIWGEPAAIHTPMNGYKGWELVLESARRRKPKRMLFPVHSNGGKFATFIMSRLEKLGVECVILMFDRTLGMCDPIESNCIGALDMHYDKSWLERSDDFKGVYDPQNFRKHPTSHIGIINYQPAQELALKFAERFKP